uniref:hypothetical protein n=1 Tax=Laribacter hongkongensis TaxID=168471 RepID=UPI0015E83F5E|nr:hypothetical protein [Laribacter hongkongensis]
MLEHGAQSESIKEKAISINSTIEVLMDSIEEVEEICRIDFSKKLIESCNVIIGTYDTINNEEGWAPKLRDALECLCRDFFDSTLGHHLNSHFWFNLKYYEWLAKEDLIYTDHLYGNKNKIRHHSDELLEKFFKEKREEIIKKMLGGRIDRYSETIIFDNPLSNNETKAIFETYKMLQKLSQKLI